jgi:hypothetical protein
MALTLLLFHDTGPAEEKQALAGTIFGWPLKAPRLFSMEQTGSFSAWNGKGKEKYLYLFLLTGYLRSDIFISLSDKYITSEVS